MHLTRIAVVFVGVCCWFAFQITAEEAPVGLPQVSAEHQIEDHTGEDAVHVREKRTLLLKKKLIGAGLLGFGLGVAKGFKFGYHSAPEVHRVYLSPPPPATIIKYVEYPEKPVIIRRIVERPAPIFKPVHLEYEPSQPYERSSYGSW